VNKSLLQELEEIRCIFVGAHLIACEELGMEPFLTAETKDPLAQNWRSAKETFKNWAARLNSDPDLSQDCRCMVPVFYDQARGQMKVWVFLGWRQKDLRVDYHHQPTVLSVDNSSLNAPAGMLPGLQGKDPRITFCGTTVRAAYPATAEIYVSSLMNREEFAAHCDRYKKEKDLLNSFKSVAV
jgi:hypothetical protein